MHRTQAISIIDLTYDPDYILLYPHKLVQLNLDMRPIILEPLDMHDEFNLTCEVHLHYLVTQTQNQYVLAHYT